MKTFKLSCGLNDYFFHGPEDVTDDEFKALCDELMEKAAWLALEQAKKDRHKVEFSDVVAHVGEVLVENGYEKCQPVSARFVNFLTPVFYAKFTGRATPAIAAHNDTVYDDRWKAITDS